MYQNSSSPSTTGADCSRDKAYLAIIITILPLWVILTTLTVFLLVTFHKNLRSTRIYDDCSKQTAQNAYYIEIRTGDTSSTYNRRRTTLTVDMFDDNQQTLARIAIPGHIIFGRKDMPISVIDDERFSELRVTRFWLYRASKLKKVSTIRITHSCMEPDARIMIYGFQIRANESDSEKAKQFFPIMSYISAFGSTAKPNACFDSDLNGSISNMGGSQEDGSSISYSLSRIDYTILIYLIGSIIWLLSSFNGFLISGELTKEKCVYKGLLVGLISFASVSLVALVHRYVIKHFYAYRIGSGPFGALYYGYCALVLILATAIWIYTTVNAFQHLCPEDYVNWILTIAVALIFVIVLAIIIGLIVWLILILNPKSVEQYALPEEYSAQAEVAKSKPQQGSAAAAPNYGYYGSSQAKYSSKQSPHWAQQHQQQQQHQPLVGIQPVQYPVYGGQHVSQVPTMLTIMSPSGAYKTVGYQAATPPHTPSQPVNAFLQQQQHQQQQDQFNAQSYHNQVNLQGIKATSNSELKKTGSNESTGSTYYQQLMKNKGGVKSISQYGELMKQKKQAKQHARQ